MSLYLPWPRICGLRRQDTLHQHHGDCFVHPKQFGKQSDAEPLTFVRKSSRFEKPAKKCSIRHISAGDSEILGPILAEDVLSFLLNRGWPSRLWTS